MRVKAIFKAHAPGPKHRDGRSWIMNYALNNIFQENTPMWKLKKQLWSVPRIHSMAAEFEADENDEDESFRL